MTDETEVVSKPNVWLRTLVIAVVVVVVVVLYGRGGVGSVAVALGRSWLPYVVTALIGRSKPRLASWYTLIPIYLVVFVLFLVAAAIGGASA